MGTMSGVIATANQVTGPVNQALSVLKDLLGPMVVAEGTNAWQLPKHIQRLQTTFPKIRTLIDRAEWRRFQDKNVADLLTNLKQTVYDAEDLLDQFAYRVLHQTIEESSAATTVWLNFCTDFLECHGQMLRDMQERLDHCAGELKEVIDLLGDSSCQYGNAGVMSATSSLIAEPEVFGRETELKELLKLLKNPGVASVKKEGTQWAKRTKRETVDVLPIVGIGGVGKTTLAQMFYNHLDVQREFQLKLWVCVSDIFDVTRITKEIVDCVNKGEGSDVTNLSFMQGALTDEVTKKKFLLVLDNVWNENIMQWERLFAPLRCGKEGSMILVTTRSLKVAEIVGTVKPVFLEGLLREPYQKLFERCSFGSDSSSQYPQLVPIARKIADGLKGSPLAAKTLGSLLNSNKNERHWRAVMTSEIWELPQKENDILPALKLSYLYLPAHLKKCFSFCSVFPKDYHLRKDFLIDMWVAQGFITPEEEKKQDIGSVYLNEFVMRSFFQQSTNDPDSYVIHDLMRDLAQSVSDGECFRIETRNYHQDIPNNVRHLSVCTDTVNMSKLQNLGSFNKLRSILLLSSLQFDARSAITSWCCLKKLRCLKIDGAIISELPENIRELTQLRYLHIPYEGIRSFPECFYQLHYLQFLYLNNWKGWNPMDSNISIAFSKLVNLRKVHPENIVVTRMAGIGKLPYLQDMHTFKVRKEDGYRIRELMHMNQLHGCFNIKGLENVENREQAAEAKLYNKQYVNELTLEWSEVGNDDWWLQRLHSEVLECLQPHSSLSQLQITWYRGLNSPIWLNKQNLPCLNSLILHNCVNLKEISSLPPSITSLRFENVGLESLPRMWDHVDTNGLYNEGSGRRIEKSSLSKLYIENCPKIVSMRDGISPEYVPLIKSISVKNCDLLKQLPTNGLLDHGSLEELIIENCPNIDYPNYKVLPSSLKTLAMDFCGSSDKSFPDYLEGLTSLIKLRIKGCYSNITSAQLSHLISLKSLSLRDCRELHSLSGLQALTLLENLHIIDCPRLVEASSSSSRPRNAILPSLKCLRIDDPAFLIHQIGSTGDPLPNLLRLEIWNYQRESVFLHEGIVKSITQLSFSNCSNLLALPQGLVDLTSLETLSFNACPVLTSLPTLVPSSLKNIYPVDCPNLVIRWDRFQKLIGNRRVSFVD